MSDESNFTSESPSIAPHSKVHAALRVVMYCALAAVVGVLGYSAVRATQDRAAMRTGQDRLVAMHGLIQPASKHLDPAYADQDGTLVADPPKDPAGFLDPATLVLAHRLGDDDDTQLVNWPDFQAHLSAATGKQVLLQEYTNSADDIADVKGGKIQIVVLHAADAPYLVNNAGFVPVAARQARTRRASPMHARHVVRLRRRFETVRLRDAIPEIVFLNSHDGTSAYQLRMGIFRVVCLNGLIVSQGAFPAYRVSHRGDMVDEVVSGALEVSERFGSLAAQVEHMERRPMPRDEQIGFAERALAVRYPVAVQSGMQPSQLLTCRRVQDTGDDLWSVFNRVQENLLVGGLSRWAASGRLTRTRRITSIREDVRLNGRLWDLATEVLAA